MATTVPAGASDNVRWYELRLRVGPRRHCVEARAQVGIRRR